MTANIMKFEYIIYKSLDKKINCFAAINRSTPRPKFKWAVEGEEIVYDKDTSYFKLKIGEILTYEI